MGTLNELQLAGLAKRFPHFDAERAGPLFHQDQDGRALWDGREYPATLMRNGVRWLYDGQNRPARHKTLAPKGPRPLLTDDPKLEGEWFIIVEGEADAVALLSVGITGVACVGGTNTAGTLAPSFTGKRLYLLFDGDKTGRRAAEAWALALQEAGALSVQVADLPEGEDPESFLAKQETPDAASAALRTLLGKAREPSASELRDTLRQRDEDDGFDFRQVWTERLEVGGPSPVLVSVVSELGEPTALAVFGPPGLFHDPHAGPTYPGTEAAEPVDVTADYAWQVFPDGARSPRLKLVLEPAGRDGMADLVADGAMVVPPPPAEGKPEREDTAQLLRDLVEHFNRWAELPSGGAELLAAFAMVTWRLEDARFDKAPFLRICGRSGKGKTQVMEVVSDTSNMAISASLTADNIHRVVQQFKEHVVCWDEFNPQNMARDTARSLINTMNLSQSRRARVLRFDQGSRGAPGDIKTFRVFGPKVFSGYLPGEDAGFRRRTLQLDMGRVQEVPDAKRFAQLPRRARDSARELRRRLLVWRGQQLALGEVDPESDPSHRELMDAKVHGLATAWWPLLYVVPQECRDVRASLLAQAHEAEEDWQASQARSESAFMLEALANLSERCVARVGGYHAVPVELLHAKLQDQGNMRLTLAEVGQRLRALGLKTERRRFAFNGASDKHTAVVFTPEVMHELAGIMAHHGVTWRPSDVRAAGERRTEAEGDPEKGNGQEGEAASHVGLPGLGYGEAVLTVSGSEPCM